MSDDKKTPDTNSMFSGFGKSPDANPSSDPTGFDLPEVSDTPKHKPQPNKATEPQKPQRNIFDEANPSSPGKNDDKPSATVASIDQRRRAGEKAQPKPTLAVDNTQGALLTGSKEKEHSSTVAPNPADALFKTPGAAGQDTPANVNQAEHSNPQSADLHNSGIELAGEHADLFVFNPVTGELEPKDDKARHRLEQLAKTERLDVVKVDPKNPKTGLRATFYPDTGKIDFSKTEKVDVTGPITKVPLKQGGNPAGNVTVTEKVGAAERGVTFVAGVIGASAMAVFNGLKWLVQKAWDFATNSRKDQKSDPSMRTQSTDQSSTNDRPTESTPASEGAKEPNPLKPGEIKNAVGQKGVAALARDMANLKNQNQREVHQSITETTQGVFGTIRGAAGSLAALLGTNAVNAAPINSTQAFDKALSQTSPENREKAKATIASAIASADSLPGKIRSALSPENMRMMNKGDKLLNYNAAQTALSNPTQGMTVQEKQILEHAHVSGTSINSALTKSVNEARAFTQEQKQAVQGDMATESLYKRQRQNNSGPSFEPGLA